MYKATDGLVMPTTVTGSLPRPAWYTENLGRRSFIEAMVNSNFREQYTDAVSAYLRDQETAGLDICTDGDARFDNEVGGQSWFSYPWWHLAGFDASRDDFAPVGPGMSFARGHILHDWNDEECIAILKNIAANCEPGDRLLIAECVVKEPNVPDPGKLLDMEMLLFLTGWERTAEEYGALLAATGFELAGVTPTDSIVSVVEGRYTG